MDALRHQRNGIQTFVRVQTNSPSALLQQQGGPSPSPTHKIHGLTTLPSHQIVGVRTFSPSLTSPPPPPPPPPPPANSIPIFLADSSGHILATRRESATTPIQQLLLQQQQQQQQNRDVEMRTRIPSTTGMRHDVDATSTSTTLQQLMSTTSMQQQLATTPIHHQQLATTPVQQQQLLLDNGTRVSVPSGLTVMPPRRDPETSPDGLHTQQETRLNMSRYSSLLHSLTDQDQASMDLEVQSVMFPESRGLLPTVKRICPSRSSSSSKASSKSSYSPMRQSTTFTNTKRGNVQTTTPTFSMADQGIHQLAAQGEQQLVTEKLEAGTDIDETDAMGNTALSWACQHNQTDMVRFLLANNADPAKASLDGETGLAFACSVGNEEVVRMLLNRKAPVNVYDYNGGTPLLYAVYHNHASIVELLLRSGADMTVEMESGHTALSLSMVLGHKGVQRVIEQHMLSLL